MKNTHRSSSKVSLCFADLHILSTTPVGKQHCYNVKCVSTHPGQFNRTHWLWATLCIYTKTQKTHPKATFNSRNIIIIPELAHKATPLHSSPAVDPNATPQCKLFLGGKLSLCHLGQLLELNLNTAAIKGRLLWKYTWDKRDSFARKRRTHAAMLLSDVTLMNPWESGTRLVPVLSFLQVKKWRTRTRERQDSFELVDEHLDLFIVVGQREIYW